MWKTTLKVVIKFLGPWKLKGEEERQGCVNLISPFFFAHPGMRWKLGSRACFYHLVDAFKRDSIFPLEVQWQSQFLTKIWSWRDQLQSRDQRGCRDAEAAANPDTFTSHGLPGRYYEMPPEGSLPSSTWVVPARTPPYRWDHFSDYFPFSWNNVQGISLSRLVRRSNVRMIFHISSCELG